MKGRGFAGLARYLEIGRDGGSPDRVAWIEARNLPTRDPHTASLIMRATASQSARVERPVYHIALAFDPDDGVDRATMLRVADRLLDDLGIREHQALIVAHGDRQHPHVHLMINRVHPETFRAWDPKHDYARIERSLREQERELALRAGPGHHYQLDGHQPTGPFRRVKHERQWRWVTAQGDRDGPGRNWREDHHLRHPCRRSRLHGRHMHDHTRVAHAYRHEARRADH